MSRSTQEKLDRFTRLEIEENFVTESTIIDSSTKSALIDAIEAEKIQLREAITIDIMSWTPPGESIADMMQGEDGRLYRLDPLTGQPYFGLLSVIYAPSIPAHEPE